MEQHVNNAGFIFQFKAVRKVDRVINRAAIKLNLSHHALSCLRTKTQIHEAQIQHFPFGITVTAFLAMFMNCTKFSGAWWTYLHGIFSSQS
jgi:hypothetical protein